MPLLEDAGILPEISPRAKQRAVEMDEALEMSHHMKDKLQHNAERQQKNTQKLKERKKKALALKERASYMEHELENAKVEAERNKVDPEVKGRFDKLQGDHATLQATHAWTKSSLDSTLAAQEEYRKGYTSLQAAYKKTKAELDKKEREAESARDAHTEAQQILATLPEKEAEFQQDLADAQDALKKIIERQKKKSRAVLDKMLAGQSSSLLTMTIQSWQKVISDDKFWRENAAALETAQGKLKDFQTRKKEEASRVLDRMTSANEQGLLATMVQYWNKHLQEVKKEKEEAAKLTETLKNAKLSARKTLMQNLSSSTTGLLTNAWKDWYSVWMETKKVRELKGQADAKLKEYQTKQKGGSASVIDRMSGQQDQSLKQRMFLCWSMTCINETEARSAYNALTNQVDDLEGILKGLKDDLAKTIADLEDTNEEIAESRRKNKILVQEFQSILELEDSMDASMKEIEDD